MALDMNRTVHGAVLTAAYHRIHYVSGNKDGMSIDVRVYIDEATYTADANDHIKELSYRMADTDLDYANSTPWGGNNIYQAYEYLKALAEYSSATDS